jgi:hypothetical protein
MLKMKPKRGNTTGVKDKFASIDLKQVERLGGLGLNYDEVARALGVAEITTKAWRDKYPEFDLALKRGRDGSDRDVTTAMRKRAMGFEVTEVTREWKVVSGRGNKARYDLIITKTVTKQIPPDTMAGMFWLQNRKPDAWKNQSTANNAGLSTEQVEALRAVADKVMEENV